MVLAKLSWQNQMVDPIVIFSHAFSLRAVHSVAREVSCVLAHVVLHCRLLQFALVRSLQGEKSGRRSTASRQGIVVHLASIEGRPEEVAVLGNREPAGRPLGESAARLLF